MTSSDYRLRLINAYLAAKAAGFHHLAEAWKQRILNLEGRK